LATKKLESTTNPWTQSRTPPRGGVPPPRGGGATLSKRLIKPPKGGGL